MTQSQTKLTRADFQIDGQVKWCAGCGGYPILAAVQKALPETGVTKENVVFISGIGCSSRFPYYMKTYGFHTLHGRALPIASGLKISRPDLHVWVATGDGDSMAIGGNHFIHTIRRNINLNIMIFNNKIYGLTKGQYSPTTPLGSITKTSPHGTIENPFLPGELTIAAQGTFFARVVDKEPKGMESVFIDAAKHDGTSVIEILQNCVIFNNDIHEQIVAKDVRDDRMILLEHDKKMIFGKENDKGLILDGQEIKAVKIGENGITMDDILVHDKKTQNPNIHYMLARMTYPELPVAIGVIRSVDQPTYEAMLDEQVEHAKKNSKIKDLKGLLHSGNIFEIK
ncbi:MAG: 2-oxoacid:ferredoxin oxidoreductase subunit beta [Bacteroidales bacterium]|nr:2-oxoacid:ferredoxin oxidoreductase subunit beta [Bacteroidales bacterium]MDD4217786.1 2-oxoacid:ferredoxin oxidoreductase subunit beta [Bacteroidales bacterium]MDY0140263.1 2-oxoacid:ferredoxin oxidoreductase subunit beta [Bacteroidales bacterium]